MQHKFKDNFLKYVATHKLLEINILITKFQAHMYWRRLRWPRVEGICPVKKLLERSSVWSFESLPISAGIGPVILLFCKSLKIKPITYQNVNITSSRKWSIHSCNFKTAHLLVITYTIWRFVKLPIVGERVPDKFWLGVPLQQDNLSNINKRSFIGLLLPFIFTSF